MQVYPVRATHRRNLEGAAIEGLLRAHFEGVEPADGTFVAHWGAISRISARAQGKQLQVDVTMNPQVPEDVARETIARYNRFLEAATGYNSKERAKRLKKSATAGGAEA